MARINWINIQGFRAFGKVAQRIEFSSCVSVLWGPNSQGKTSFAEAVEFLLTGTIVRRELLASSQDEFADSLRNAHLPERHQVFVEAELVDTLGVSHAVRRVLASDFSKKGTCTTTLQIDGKTASQDGLRGIGVKLSQPPMSVPILMQHTLGYLFTAKPQERALYFKTLFEVDDLDRLRNAISQQESTIDISESQQLADLRTAATIPSAERHLAPLLEVRGKAPQTKKAIISALGAVLTSEGLRLPETETQMVAAFDALLAEKEARTFPLTQFSHDPLPTPLLSGDDLWVRLEAFETQRRKVDDETKNLVALFNEVLKVPVVGSGTETIDCPVCGTEDALTPERIGIIRSKTEASREYVDAQELASTALRQLASTLTSLETALDRSRPQFFRVPRRQRRERGFALVKMRELLPSQEGEKIEPWVRALRVFLRDRNRALKAIMSAKQLAQQGATYFLQSDKIAQLKEFLSEATKQYLSLVESETAYSQTETPVKAALQSVVSARSNTAGWQELLNIARNQESLRADLIGLLARSIVKRELVRSVKDVDRAKEEVLNDKFGAMSLEIIDWWDRLRPDEPVFFSGVNLRPSTVRTIDFKAALTSSGGRANPHIRDVIAIFSVSQLHCLGLASFLAKAVRDKSGFIVLDDPILSSDEDHRAHFLHECVRGLIETGHQVIILTQDQQMQRTLADLYAHKDIDCFEVTMTEPSDGTVVNKKSDSVSAMLTRAQPFVKSASLDIRKLACERLRDIAERVCKEIIVGNERRNGNAKASVVDYTGQRGTLDSLIPAVQPYLTDPSHSGKLRVMARSLNPGKHDDLVPTKDVLAVAYGDLDRFRKDYGIS